MAVSLGDETLMKYRAQIKQMCPNLQREWCAARVRYGPVPAQIALSLRYFVLLYSSYWSCIPPCNALRSCKTYQQPTLQVKLYPALIFKRNTFAYKPRDMQRKGASVRV